MMKTLFLLLFPAVVFAQQTKGTVTDSLTGKPIKYVNIWVDNEDISAMADSLGQYAIRTTNAGKVLVFSAAGYQSKKVKLTETRGLKLSPIAIPENQERLGTKTAKLGDYNLGRGDLTYGSHGKPWMIARKFTLPANSETPFLKEIEMYTDCHNNNMKCSLRFFEVDENGKPGKEILDKLVIFRVDRGRNDTKVDLSEYNIKFPEKGLFIAYSWLIIDQNVKKWYDKRPMQFKDYDPGIGASPSNESTTWSYSLGKWQEEDRYTKENAMKAYRNKFVELAMKLTLSN